MIGFVAGLVVGAGGVVAKDMITENNPNSGKNTLRNEADKLSDENETLRKRLRDCETQIDNLLSENEKLRQKSKDYVDDKEDLSDDLDAAKKEIRKLRAQNDELARKVQEYMAACDSYERELKQLKL